MSYILDALQRAQAQREQGSVPGLHTGPLVPAAPRTRSRTAWVLGALGLVAALALLGIGWWPGAHPTADPPVPAPGPAATAIPAPTRTPVATVPAPAASVAVAAFSQRPAAKPMTAAPNPAQTPLLAELPDDLRRQLPALNVTGAVQAQDPRHSLLLVNGQVLSPGAELAPGLVLESVDAHSAVLRWNGTRFRVGY